MFITVFLLLLGSILFYMIFVRGKRRLDHIPGPKGNYFMGVTLQVKRKELHRQFEGWKNEYGPIFQLPLLNRTMVIVNDLDSIYEMLVKQGKEFGGRPHGFRSTLIMQQTGILLSPKPDKLWRSLRKSTHQHLKQFGEGMTRLEKAITDVAEDMFDSFKQSNGKPFDPYDVIIDTALNNIAVLITGIQAPKGHPLVEKMKIFENTAPQFFQSVNFKYTIYDILPALRHLGLSSWKDIQSVLTLEETIWDETLKTTQDKSSVDSFVTTMLDQVQSTDPTKAVLFSETDVRKTTLSLLFAGVTTTSASFYATVNILAHHPDIQTKIHEEITQVCDGDSVMLVHRELLPYTRAVLLELLRYVSVVALGVPHVTVAETTLSGYYIPKNTYMFTNLWAMHHDPTFWDDPFVIRPERFLDENGDMVPADHPNRRHLMPFGAGSRVCVGESLAMARLFLWLTTLVQRFEIVPAEGNLKSSADPRNFEFDAILRVTRYSVKFISR